MNLWVMLKRLELDKIKQGEFVVLKEVKIEITNLCYRNCMHCSSEATNDCEAHLFLEKDLIKSILKQASEMGAKSVVFTGGEATLHPDLQEVIECAKKLNLYTKLYSMCYRTYDNIKLLQKLNEIGLNEIIYSTASNLILSEDLSTYSIDKFVQLLTKSTSLLIGFHHVVTSQTIDCINELYKYADAAMNNLNKVSFLRYVPHGRGTNNLIPSKEQMEKFKTQLLSLKNKYPDNIRIGSPFNVLHITNTPCNAAEETMIIGFDGKVYPCDAMKYFDYFGSGGNIYDNSLSDIYDSKYFQDVRLLKGNHDEACIKCNNYSICKSGCLGQKMVHAISNETGKTLEWYEVNAKRTMNDFASLEIMRLNAKMGIAGETGELIDCVKKLLTHDCNEERQETIKRLMLDEIGDIVWYIASSLSSYYQISFSEIGSHLFNEEKEKIKIVDQNMVKHCAMLKDPDCPYAVVDRSCNISKIDTLISKNNNVFDITKLWEELDVVSFQLRRSEVREDVIDLSSKMLIILGKICHGVLDTTLEKVLISNIARLQQRYPMGFDREKASDRIDIEEIYKTDQMSERSHIKKK